MQCYSTSRSQGTTRGHQEALKRQNISWQQQYHILASAEVALAVCIRLFMPMPAWAKIPTTSVRAGSCRSASTSSWCSHVLKTGTGKKVVTTTLGVCLPLCPAIHSQKTLWNVTSFTRSSAASRYANHVIPLYHQTP